MHILYVGSIVSPSGRTPTSIETLAPRFQQTHSVVMVSAKRHWFFRAVESLRSILHQRNLADVVIFDTYSTRQFWLVVFLSLICRCLRLRYILFLHGGDLPKRIETNPLTCKILFDRSFANVAPSSYLRDALLAKGIDVEVIPNAISCSDYTYNERSCVRPSLLYVRAFEEKTYNPKLAIQTLNLLKQWFPDARLCMVGPDKDGSRASCEELARHFGLEECVTFTGRLTKKQWLELSTKYDIFINTSNVDNQPVSLIEAAASGMPIVTTSVGGIPHVFNQHFSAVLVPAGDEFAMAEGVRSLVHNSQLAMTLSKNGKELADQYCWKTVGKKWQALFDKL